MAPCGSVIEKRDMDAAVRWPRKALAIVVVETPGGRDPESAGADRPVLSRYGRRRRPSCGGAARTPPRPTGDRCRANRCFRQGSMPTGGVQRPPDRQFAEWRDCAEPCREPRAASRDNAQVSPGVSPGAGPPREPTRYRLWRFVRMLEPIENGGRPWNRTRRGSPRRSYSPLPHLAARRPTRR